MKHSKYKLSNNLRVILAPMHETQTVTVMLMAATGSRHETKKNNGIAHFLEHMFFKGTEKRPNTLAITEEMDAIGGEYNAFTSKERTAYYAKSDARHLTVALDVVSDMLLHSKFEPEEIEREKGTILQEISMYEDMPARIIGDHFEALLYGDHPMGWETAGRKENIRRFSRKDFIQYLSSQYRSESLVLVVAGKFNEKKTKKLIAQYFSSFPKGLANKAKKAINSQKTPGLIIKNKKTDQTHFILGVRTFNALHPDRYALAIMANILGGNMSSRLFIEVRERRGLAYRVSTSVDAYSDSGYLATQCGVEHGNLEKTLQVVLEEYRKISNEKVSSKELVRAKECLKAQLAMSLEASDEVAGYLVEQEISRKEIILPEEINRRVDAVTEDDLLRVAKNIFRNDRLNLAVITPKAKAKSINKILKL